MKKVFSLIAFMCISLFSAYAQDPTVTVYAEDATTQPGEEVTLNIYASNSIALGAISYEIVVPDGFTILEDPDDTTAPYAKGAGVCSSFTTTGIFTSTGAKVTSFSTGTFAASDDAKQIGTIKMTAPSTIGSYDITISLLAVSDGLKDYYPTYTQTSTLTVQRTEVIAGLPEGYGVEIIPFAAADGDVTLTLNYKSATDIKNISFDVELPAGMAFVDDSEWDKSNVVTTLTASTNGTPTTTTTFGTGDAPTTATISVAGTYTAKSKKYIKAATELSRLATITADVLTQSDIDDFEWSGDIMSDGISQIKVKNISITDVNGTSYTGEYIASVFFGTPTETDPIVYGHYTADGLAALKSAVSYDETTKLPNFTSVDMSAATVDAEESEVAADLNGILVYGPAKTSYNRTITSTYGTVCLPFALTSGTTKYYQIASITKDKMTLEEVETVAANTPVICKGNIVAQADGYQYASAPVEGASANGFTMKGTYTSYDLESGAGYYISGDTFYGDGAEVGPFRGYISGTVLSSKLRIVIEDETGIHDITDQLSNEDIYTLQGVRVKNAQKGVNIIGGKKVYNK